MTKKIDIFDLQDIATILDLRNRGYDEDWRDHKTDADLPAPVHRQYSMDRGDIGVGMLDPVCRVHGCDSILTVSDSGGICRQCKLEGLGL